MRKDVFVPGPLADNDPDNLEASLAKAVKVLSQVLNWFGKTVPDHWALGDSPGGYLCTNIGIRAIFHVMADILEHVKQKSGIDTSLFTADEILDELKNYLNPILGFFTSAQPEDIQGFRGQGSSLAAAKKQSQGMCVLINDKFPDFSPSGLVEYIESCDQEGKEEAMLLIIEIETRLFSYTIAALKDKFGEQEDKWWYEGVPEKERSTCSAEHEKQKGKNPRETYLYLINFLAIAFQNWDLMKSHYALGEKNIDDRKFCLKWLQRLNEIRKITHHPPKGGVVADDVAFVREIAEKVRQYFP